MRFRRRGPDAESRVAPLAVLPVRGWTGVPPLQRVVEPLAPIASRDAFTGSLTSWRDPSFLAPLGHLVDAAAPAGVVPDLARPVPAPPGPTLPLAHRAPTRSARRGPVQRVLDALAARPLPARSAVAPEVSTHPDAAPTPGVEVPVATPPGVASAPPTPEAEVPAAVTSEVGAAPVAEPDLAERAAATMPVRPTTAARGPDRPQAPALQRAAELVGPTPAAVVPDAVLPIASPRDLGAGPAPTTPELATTAEAPRPGGSTSAGDPVPVPPTAEASGDAAFAADDDDDHSHSAGGDDVRTLDSEAPPTVSLLGDRVPVVPPSTASSVSEATVAAADPPTAPLPRPLGLQPPLETRPVQRAPKTTGVAITAPAGSTPPRSAAPAPTPSAPRPRRPGLGPPREDGLPVQRARAEVPRSSLAAASGAGSRGVEEGPHPSARSPQGSVGSATGRSPADPGGVDEATAPDPADRADVPLPLITHGGSVSPTLAVTTPSAVTVAAEPVVILQRSISDAHPHLATGDGDARPVRAPHPVAAAPSGGDTAPGARPAPVVVARRTMTPLPAGPVPPAGRTTRPSEATPAAGPPPPVVARTTATWDASPVPPASGPAPTELGGPAPSVVATGLLGTRPLTAATRPSPTPPPAPTTPDAPPGIDEPVHLAPWATPPGAVPPVQRAAVPPTLPTPTPTLPTLPTSTPRPFPGPTPMPPPRTPLTAPVTAPATTHAVVVHRAPDPTPPPAEAPAPLAPPTPATPPSGTAAEPNGPDGPEDSAPGPPPPAPPSPEELARTLFDPLLRRLRAELRLERERRGLLSDLRH